MTSLVFPDINVWLALASSSTCTIEHAKRWYDSLDDEQLLFCRFTQLGLLRLLTAKAIMGQSLSPSGRLGTSMTSF